MLNAIRTFSLLGALFFTTDLAAASDTTPFKTFKSDRYSIDYPTTWELAKETKEFKLLLKSPRYGKIDFFQENISLSIKPITADTSLASCAEQSLEILDGTFNNFDVLTDKEVSFKKMPAYKVIFTGSIAVYNTKRDFKLQQLFIKKNGQLYILTYTGEASTWNFFKPSIDTIFNSLKIK